MPWSQIRRAEYQCEKRAVAQKADPRDLGQDYEAASMLPHATGRFSDNSPSSPTGNLILAGQNAYAFRPSFTRLTLSPVSRSALPFAPLGFRLHRDAG
jgi:hypothetical protein